MAEKKYSFQATAAAREEILLRAGFCGPTGSGKTWTMLMTASRMREKMGTGPIYFIDTEHKSALKYARSKRSGKGFEFMHVPMEEDDNSPEAYTAALDYCEAQGAGIIIVDTLSHMWSGIGGTLEMVDTITDKSRSKSQFSEGWRAMTPAYKRAVERLMSCGAHLLFGLRAKVEFILQEDERGKKAPVKMGLAAEMREGIDYEPDVYFDMTVPDNSAVVAKTRCDRFAPGDVIKKPGVDFADLIIEWLTDAEPAPGARTLGEAITFAVADGCAAVAAKDPTAYMAARAKLAAWCKSNGVSEARHEIAQKQARERTMGSVGAEGMAAVMPAPKAAEAGAAPVAAKPAAVDPANDPASKALADDIKRRLDAAESDESIDATASEIRNLPETLRPALRVTADKMRVALARTTVRLDEIQSSDGYARHAEKGRRFLDGAVAAKREELTHHAQAPAPAE